MAANKLHDEQWTKISKIGVLYQQLERKQQKQLLREIVQRIVVDAEGTILRIDLLPPFAYLHDLSRRVQITGRAESEAKKEKSSPETGSCSSSTFLNTPSRTRTCASASGGQRSIL